MKVATEKDARKKEHGERIALNPKREHEAHVAHPTNLVAPPSKISKSLDRHANVRLERQSVDGTRVERLDRRQLFEVGFHEVGKLVHECAAVTGVHITPVPLERGVGSNHSGVDIPFVSKGNVTDGLFGCWVDGLKQNGANMWKGSLR